MEIPEHLISEKLQDAVESIRALDGVNVLPEVALWKFGIIFPGTEDAFHDGEDVAEEIMNKIQPILDQFDQNVAAVGEPEVWDSEHLIVYVFVDG